MEKVCFMKNQQRLMREMRKTEMDMYYQVNSYVYLF